MIEVIVTCGWNNVLIPSVVKVYSVFAGGLREDGELVEADDLGGGHDSSFDTERAAYNYQQYKRRRLEQQRAQQEQSQSSDVLCGMASSITNMSNMMQAFMQNQLQPQAYMYNSMQSWQQMPTYQGYGGTVTTQPQGTVGHNDVSQTQSSQFRYFTSSDTGIRFQ